MDGVADRYKPALPPQNALRGLFVKFLVVMVPVFLLLAIPGISLIIEHELREERQNLAARVGIQAARIAILLGRQGSSSIAPFAQDILKILAADPAFRCAEYRPRDPNALIFMVPMLLGCSKFSGTEQLTIPIGDPPVADLLVRFSDDEIRQVELKQQYLTLVLVGVGFLFSILAASLGFRLIVGKPLRQLLHSIQTSIATGVRTPLRIQSSDEIGIVMNAFNEMVERDTDREIVLLESERRYRELFEESPVPILEEDWGPVREFLDRLSKRGVKNFPGFFRENEDQLVKAYEAANRFGITQAVVELYRADSKEDVQALMTHAPTVREKLLGYGDMISAFYAGATKFEYEADEIACDGAPVKTRIRAVMPPKYRENWSRVLVTIEDITARKRAEDQLRQAQKMEAVGQLTGGVAHDFNNLLAVIQGNAELLSDDVGSNDIRTTAIMRAIARGAELTQRLLAFSRQQPMKTRPVDPAETVTGILDLLKRTLGEAIEIETIAPSDLWTVMTDPGHLENALLNLAINARDAMPNGGKLVIECSNAQLDAPDQPEHLPPVSSDYVSVAVTDTGVGMSPEARSRAFEPFFTTKEVGKGSGLGLSMVYGFANQSGGHVFLYSEEGIGTTVKLYLPRTLASARRETATQEPNAPRGRGELILVIEDDADLRALTVQVLKDLDYRVVEAADAAAARDVLAAGTQVDLVLSDVVLPGGTSGPEFAEQARATYPDLKVIFMSGYLAEAAKRDEFLNLDQALLNKPFRRHKLAQVIQNALS